MKAQGPDGQTWRVTRRWFPWRLRWRRDSADDVDPSFDLGDDLVVGIVLVIVLALLAPVLVPLLVGTLELLLLLLVLPAAVVGRVLLGRRWVVEVRRGWRPWHEGTTGSWNNATVRISELVADLQRGEVPPATLVRDRRTPEEAA